MRLFGDPTTIKSLLSFLKTNNCKFHKSAIKTAITTGWMTDGAMLFKLTDKERADFQKKYGDNEEVKTAGVLNIEPIMKMEVKTMLDVIDSVNEQGENPPLVVLGAGTKRVFIRSDHYQFLTKRHPKAYFHLTDTDAKLAFAERMTVACVMEYRKK